MPKQLEDVFFYVRGLTGLEGSLDLIDDLVAEVMMAVAEDLLLDVSVRIHDKLTPMGGPQKANSKSWAAEKGHDTPLLYEGILSNPKKYVVDVNFGLVSISPPPERLGIIEKLKDEGYAFFEIPSDDGNEASWLQEEFDWHLRQKSAKHPYDSLFANVAVGSVGIKPTLTHEALAEIRGTGIEGRRRVDATSLGADPLNMAVVPHRGGHILADQLGGSTIFGEDRRRKASSQAGLSPVTGPRLSAI